MTIRLRTGDDPVSARPAERVPAKNAGVPDLAYDMMLEVEGLMRSQTARVTLDRELELGETFQMHGRRWVVAQTGEAKAEAIDRRLVAREAVDSPGIAGSRLGL